MTITNLADVLRFIVCWEQNLDHYYRYLLRTLFNERSKTAVSLLKNQQEEILAILKKIHISEYENYEFTQNIPDCRIEDIISSLQMSRHCHPDELFHKILECEEKLEAYYAEVRNILISRKSIELFDLLIQMKVCQIRRIKELLGCYDMAV